MGLVAGCGPGGLCSSWHSVLKTDCVTGVTRHTFLTSSSTGKRMRTPTMSISSVPLIDRDCKLSQRATGNPQHQAADLCSKAPNQKLSLAGRSAMLYGSVIHLVVLSALLAACHGAKLDVDGGKVVQQVCAWETPWVTASLSVSTSHTPTLTNSQTTLLVS